MELTESQKDLIVLASHLRGGIKCQLTKERKCGYLIRPELWFIKMNDPIKRALELLGVEVRGTYSGWREMSIILEGITGLEYLSPTPKGIENVRLLNGQIFQPKTHDEVMATIQSIEELLRMNA
tara:strand:+ start:6140 stop:6511 length:372 start_codon:yes stop_codon:yes gene_type:complete